MTHYKNLVEYNQDFGNCIVPSKYESNRKLGIWVQSQHKLYRSGDMREDRVTKLNKLGFRWEVNMDDAWMKRYNELVKYRREFGNCNVPVKYQSQTLLGEWVRRQRQHFKNKSLREERINKLNQIGFAWT
jgi:hypothetical protein